MKALLVADNELVIEHVSTVLKTAGYDMITYHALLKALDNIEEISPHLIVISTKEYPRHWKTLAQYATVPLGSYTPEVILYTGGAFSEEDQKKAEALQVRGWFSSVDVDGLDDLRRIINQKDDIFAGELTENEGGIRPIEIPDDFAEKHANNEQMLESFVEEEIKNPGVSLEKIGLEMENEVTRASSPLEAAAVTDEELEESDDQLEEIEEIAFAKDAADVTLDDEAAVSSDTAPSLDEAEKEAPSFAVSIDDILKQNQSFNRFAEIPDIKTEEEAKSGGERVYEFGDVKGRREDAGDLGKSPMDLWAEIEAEEGGVFDDEPEPEPNFNPISISLEELNAVSQTKPVVPEEKPMSISLEELLAAQKAVEGERAQKLQMESSVKEKIQKVAENAVLVEQDPEHPVTVTQQEVDEVQERARAEKGGVLTVDDILAQNQTTDKQLDWLANENADEPDHPDSEQLDVIADPTGAAAQSVAENLGDILAQNQTTDKQLDWLSNENADEPDELDADGFDDIADPTGAAAQNVAENLGDILAQNQTTDKHLDWLSHEQADEPDYIDADTLDDIADPTGSAANDVASSLQDILSQNQIMDRQLAWLSDENADEPEEPGVAFDLEPEGMSASERDAHVRDILSQNQTMNTGFQVEMDELQRLVDKLNILRSIVCTLLLTNPTTGVLISGVARNYNRNTLEFTPDIPEFARDFTEGTKIPSASLKTENGIEPVTATVISTGEQYLLSIAHE